MLARAAGGCEPRLFGDGAQTTAVALRGGALLSPRDGCGAQIAAL